MKNIILMVMAACLLPATAQNWTTVSATNITDLNQQKLAAGQLCFLGTDQNDVPVSFNVGGGGQVLKRPFCTPIANGAVSSFTVPNPVNTAPAGVYYRVTVKDVNSGQEVLRYTQVNFSGAAFNFDNYAPVLSGASFAPLTGNSVSGNLSVSGNASITGTITASNLPGGQIATGTGTTNAISKYTNGGSAVIGNSDLTDDGNTLTVNDSLQITANTGLGVSGTGGKIAGGFTTPSAIRHYCGDGTGWRCEFAKRTSSTDTLEAWITDGGVFNIATGIQINGGAPSGNVLRGNGTNFVASQLAAVDLSNGVTGSGAVALATSPSITNPSLTTPIIGSAGATFNGSTTGNTVLKASATASGVLTLPGTTDTIAVLGTAQTWGPVNQTNMQLLTPKLNGTTINGVPGVMQFSCTGTASPSTTLSIAGGPCTNTTAIQFSLSSAATIANLRCIAQHGGVNASSGAFTVRKNGVSQAITCTMGTGGTCSDLAHTFSIAAGDAVDIIFTTQSSEVLANIGCTVEKQ